MINMERERLKLIIELSKQGIPKYSGSLPLIVKNMDYTFQPEKIQGRNVYMNASRAILFSPIEERKLKIENQKSIDFKKLKEKMKKSREINEDEFMIGNSTFSSRLVNEILNSIPEKNIKNIIISKNPESNPMKICTTYGEFIIAPKV